MPIARRSRRIHSERRERRERVANQRRKQIEESRSRRRGVIARLRELFDEARRYMRQIDEVYQRYAGEREPDPNEVLHDVRSAIGLVEEGLRLLRWRRLITMRPLVRIFDVVANRITTLYNANTVATLSQARQSAEALRYSDAPWRTTLATHSYCRISRILTRWIPTIRDVPIYFAYTHFKDDDVKPAFPTANPESSSLAIIEKLLKKRLRALWTTLIEMIRRIRDLVNDVVTVLRRDDSAPRRSLRAVIAMYLPHRVLQVRARATGKREEIDTMIHCSVYFLPGGRIARRKRGYRFTEACIGRFCVRRIRIATMEVIE